MSNLQWRERVAAAFVGSVAFQLALYWNNILRFASHVLNILIKFVTKIFDVK